MFTRRRTGKQGTDRGTYSGGSLVFNGSSQYLTRTFGTSTDINACTVSFWMKGDPQNGASHFLFGAYQGTNEYTNVNFVNGFFILDTRDGSTTARNRDTEDAGLLRDPHKWYHVVMQFDMDAGAANIWTVYVDNVLYADAVRNSTIVQVHLNDSSISHIIGARNTGSVSAHFSGYLADWHWIDGDHTIAPTEFAEVSADTGAWIPKAYTGSYGNNGYRLTFSDADTTTVTDQSGNGNDWTENGYSSNVGGSYTNDTMIDNYSTLNVLHGRDGTGNPVFSNGNRTITTVSSASNYELALSTIPIKPNSGLFVAEILMSTFPNTNTQIMNFGITAAGFEGTPFDVEVSFGTNNITNSIPGAYWDDRPTVSNRVFVDGTQIRSDTSISQGEYGYIAYNSNNGNVWFGIEDGAGGINWWDSSSGTTGDPDTDSNPVGTITDYEQDMYLVYGGYDTTGGSMVQVANFGATDFANTVPTTAKTLSTANLSEPTIKLPQKYADIGLHTGNGVNPRSLDFSLSFTPDFSWTKSRDETWNHTLYDVIRAVQNELVTNSTATETNQPVRGYLTSFDNGGITVASGSTDANQVNDPGQDYWSLLLKAGGSGVANTDGSISSTVSYGNGFSIVTYTGTGVNATVGHGGTLGRAPDMIIIKERSNDAGDWYVYHSSNTVAPETDHLHLNTTAATADDNTVFNDTEPTSTVFSIGTDDDVNGSTDTYVAYCFWFDKGRGDTPYVGGSYTGNGSTDGALIPTDEMLMAMFKRTDSTGSWEILDRERSPYNPANSEIYADSSLAEVLSDRFDFLSNGIKLRTTSTGFNASGGTYIWFGIKKIDIAYS